jgi:hypothetical protein
MTMSSEEALDMARKFLEPKKVLPPEVTDMVKAYALLSVAESLAVIANHLANPMMEVRNDG